MTEDQAAITPTGPPRYLPGGATPQHPPQGALPGGTTPQHPPRCLPGGTTPQHPPRYLPGGTTPQHPPQAPDRNLALELARATEAAAMAAGRWGGRGDKNGADAAAVNAMRLLINTVSVDGVVVIGEGEKDNAPMLYNGESVGDGSGPACDVAVDPIDGTRLCANGMPNGISVLAVAARARIKLITDGDVAGAIMTAREGTGVDLLLGVGGTPEGIIAACAIKCLGGVVLGKLWPRDDAERRRALDAGHDLDRVLATDELVSSDDVFFAATGITDGELMAGVRYHHHGGAATHSLVMRSRSGTIRSITSEHQLWKLRAYSSVNFDTAD